MSSLSQQLEELRKQKQANLARAKKLEKKIRDANVRLQNAIARIGWQAVLNVVRHHYETLRTEIIAEARVIAKDHEADVVEGLGEVLYPIAIPEHSEPEEPTIADMRAGPAATKSALECQPSSTLSTPPDAAVGVSVLQESFGAGTPVAPARFAARLAVHEPSPRGTRRDVRVRSRRDMSAIDLAVRAATNINSSCRRSPRSEREPFVR